MKKEDRRIRMTRQLLTQAMIDLLKEHHISKITVTMLCESADVSRGTFYTHFRDPFDLLQQIEAEVYQELQSRLASEDIIAERLKRLLDYIARNKDVFEVMLGDNGTRKIQESVMRLAQEAKDNIMQQIDDTRLSNYLQRFTVFGAVSVLQLWLEDDMPESTEYMADLLLGLIQEGATNIAAN